MSYASASIGAVLDNVNRRYFLPAIQRPYVWSSDQVVMLFDSLLKGYPISSFMFWSVDQATKREVRIYRFFEDYHPDKQNDPTSPDGRDVVLVLDGQQRLTSLLIGLRGTFAEKGKHARKANPTPGRHRPSTSTSSRIPKTRSARTRPNSASPTACVSMPCRRRTITGITGSRSA
jgi:Protein of unknown function DUF262